MLVTIPFQNLFLLGIDIREARPADRNSAMALRESQLKKVLKEHIEIRRARTASTNALSAFSHSHHCQAHENQQETVNHDADNGTT